MAWGNPDAAPAAPVELVKDSPEWLAKRDALLLAWETSKTVMAAAKESELQARIAFGDFAFPVDKRKSGVNKLELSNGYVAKLGHKINHKIVASNDAVDDAEIAAADVGNEGQFLFERIITWEPKFSVGEYNKLSPELSVHAKIKEIVDHLIEVSNGTPSLEIVAPKATLNG